MKAITPDLEYLSTRQSAKVLQVSLGTVQKMVELLLSYILNLINSFEDLENTNQILGNLSGVV